MHYQTYVPSSSSSSSFVMVVFPECLTKPMFPASKTKKNLFSTFGFLEERDVLRNGAKSKFQRNRLNCKEANITLCCT